MSLSEKHVRDLVVASLAVNNYPATDVWALLPAMRELRVLDAEWVANHDNGSIVEALEAAGYRRGKINWIVAPRLHTLMSEIEAGSLDDLPTFIAARDEAAATAALTAIGGIGPRVAATAWMLLTSDPEKE